MKRNLSIVVGLCLLSGAALAGSLEKEVRGQWLGAWVVTGVESYSACGSAYTNNRINGSLVKSKGGHRFQPGELAKVNKIDLKKSRVDLLLTLAEPMLIPYQEGPFTLYREAQCKIELEIMVDRDAVKTKDLESLDRTIAAILERYSTEELARQSDHWNEREMESYPADYDQTLAELAVWRANQANARVQAKLDLAHERTTTLAYKLSTDPDYLEGFARGVEAARSAEPRDCPALLAVDLGGSHRTASRSQSTEDEAKQRSDRGYQDGRSLVYGLILLDRLPACFVPVPGAPDRQLALSQ
jgi:hypothetical protein